MILITIIIIQSLQLLDFLGLDIFVLNAIFVIMIVKCINAHVDVIHVERVQSIAFLQVVFINVLIVIGIFLTNSVLKIIFSPECVSVYFGARFVVFLWTPKKDNRLSQ